jgi:hypothetical protein
MFLNDNGSVPQRLATFVLWIKGFVMQRIASGGLKHGDGEIGPSLRAGLAFPDPPHACSV